jgi:hypothetical protein
MLRVGAVCALSALLAACGAAPVVQSQSGSAGDARPAEQTSIDQDLLRQVDAKLADARARGDDVSTAQTLRDSAVELAQKGHEAEANGNLKMAAIQLGVLRPVGDAPPPKPAPAINAAPAPAATGDEQGTMLLNATFDTAGLDQWQRVGPHIPTGTPLWEVRDGMLEQRGVDGIDAVGEQTGLVTGDSAWSDVTVRVNVLARDTKEVGVIVRQQGESYYRFRALVLGAEPNKGNYILEKVIDGQVTRLATFDGPELSSGVWHTLAVTAQGATLRCYIDGKLMGSIEDASLKSGRAGVSTLAMSGAFFENLQVIGR